MGNIKNFYKNTKNAMPHDNVKKIIEIGKNFESKLNY